MTNGQTDHLAKIPIQSNKLKDRLKNRELFVPALETANHFFFFSFLVSPELSEFVDSFDDGGHDGGGGHVDQALHVVDGLLFVEVQTKLVLQL